jgi:phosphate transport system substrate-binding protein
MILRINRIKRYYYFEGKCILVFYLCFFACSSKEEKTQDLATTGQIEVKTDEVFFPIVQSQAYIFESIYKNAKINIVTAPETEVIDSFVNGKSEIIVTGRRLSREEIDYVGKKNFSVYQTLIALDAIVLIVNKNFPDSTLGLDELASILSGKKKNWQEINATFKNAPVKLVFDKNNSSTLLYINEKMPVSTDSVSLFTAGSIPKVIDFIKNNDYSIGVIGWSWLSDEEDPKTVEILQNVKILGLGKNKQFYYPGTSEVNDSLYPLGRPIKGPVPG